MGRQIEFSDLHFNKEKPTFTIRKKMTIVWFALRACLKLSLPNQKTLDKPLNYGHRL